MKINKKANETVRPFWSFRYGDTFLMGNDVYMKISHRECKELECDECSNTMPIWDCGDYAVNLANGEVRNVSRDDEFEPCECEVNLIERV